MSGSDDFSWLPSHYGVCRFEMTFIRSFRLMRVLIVWFHLRRLRVSRPRGPQPESLYFPRSLRYLAARCVVLHSLSKSNLPQELLILCSEIDPMSPCCEEKQRACAQESLGGNINIGMFRDFPDVLCSPQPTPGPMFHTNLIQQVNTYLSKSFYRYNFVPI